MRGAELPYTWAELQAKIQAGDFSNIYVGDYKAITLTTGEEVVMEVAGIDTYYHTGQPSIVQHHVDFISRDCLAGTKRFNATNTNNGNATTKNPWLASELYQTLNNESTGIYSTLPEDLKPHIISKWAMVENRYSAGGAVQSNMGWEWYRIGKLWLPSEIEVFGHATWSEPNGYGGGGVNLHYPIFVSTKHIIKTATFTQEPTSRRVTWWELTARKESSTHFCEVCYDGGARADPAIDESIHVPLCFRIG